jgi:hypothetical protein
VVCFAIGIDEGDLPKAIREPDSGLGFGGKFAAIAISRSGCFSQRPSSWTTRENLLAGQAVIHRRDHGVSPSA